VSEVGRHVPRGGGYVSRNDAEGEKPVVDDVVQRGELLQIGREDLLHELARVGRYVPV
jgi:hypothetical protein